MTGVDKLHTEGLKGDGVLVGIIDTGIDYNHPALGGCFGPGCKVAGGTDLVGDAYNGTNTPIPGKMPLLTYLTKTLIPSTSVGAMELTLLELSLPTLETQMLLNLS
jgi:subtilisin family serine protease